MQEDKQRPKTPAYQMNLMNFEIMQMNRTTSNCWDDLLWNVKIH